MYNDSIEDIMIDKNSNNGNKKGKKVLVVLIILIMLLAGAVAAYYYYVEMNKETNKELFLKGILNTNLEFFVENDTYKELVKKVSSNSFEMSNDFTVSTTMETEGIEETDNFSKFLLNWTMIQNRENEENYNEFNLSYADNKLLNVKLINNKEQVAIVSDEIVNKYVGIQKSNANVFFEKIGIETEIMDQFSDIKEQNVLEDIDLDETTKKEKKDEYLNFLLSKLGEEKFTSKENQISLVKENSQEVIVNAYTLSLLQEEYATIAKEVLTKLKNDKTFIQKFINNSSKNDEITNSTNNMIEESTESDVQENMNIIMIPNLNPIGTELQSDENVSNNSIIEETQETSNLEIENILLPLLLGKKINVTVEDIEKVIDDAIENISNVGNGLEITVYVSEVATEKVSIVLPDESTFDMEFNPQSETEKNIVITYLYKEEPVDYGENGVAVYSGAEESNLEEAQSLIEPKTNGVKLEIDKVQNTASTKIKVVCNVIEDKEINQKLSVNLTTKGTTSSKKFNNECIITYSNNDGEFKANIKNSINFDKVSEIEKLTDENCLFLDTLSDEELQVTITAITTQMLEVYNTKKQNLNFIDTNVQAPDITENNVNRDELRNLLIETVSLQMGDAQSRGEEYTLQNLENLQIQGHMVSVVIQNDIAEISIDGVKFRIDQNFNLSDA